MNSSKSRNPFRIFSCKNTFDFPDAEERAEKFKHQYLSRLKSLQVQPCAHGNLTVRSLLDMREHCLSEFNFHDPYMKQKQMEARGLALQML